MQIHSLVPGSYVTGLVVELHALHGAAATKFSTSVAAGSSTTYRATVRDATGLCTLVYRPGPRCNPAGIRKGNLYAVTGGLQLLSAQS
jgi:hypothetical protein